MRRDMASRGAAARSFGREPRWTSQKKALRFPPVSWLGPRCTDACWIWRIAGLTYGFAPARLARTNDALTTPEKSFEALATQRLGPSRPGAMGAFIGREQATTECCCYSFANGENLTFGTLAARPKPAETLACSRYHLLCSDH
jgi:hypothetical protein